MNTKSSLANIGEILGLQPSQFTFLNPPLASVPYTSITDLAGAARKISDPTKTLRPIMGNERIQIKTLKIVNGEKGPSGENVYKIDGEERVRFVGIWKTYADILGTYVGANFDTSSFYEVTFYGTNLNLLGAQGGTTQQHEVSVDGGAFGSNIFPALNQVIDGLNYATRHVIPLTSTLTEGWHTVRVRNSNASNIISAYGFEIVNNAATIRIPQGELLANGKKYTNSTAQLLAYNSGFDGSPVLNGKGGRVAIYQRPNGTTGKVIRQVDASQLNMSAADHTNEQVIQKIHFRDFGANKSDDFSTLLTTPGDRAFTLDDGTTTLVGKNVRAVVGDVLNPSSPGSDYITLTFVGTGLDVVRQDDGNSGSSHSYSVTVDGTSIGSYSNPASTKPRIEKIVSGLSYGSHTVKITNTASPVQNVAFTHFITYGPKAPTLPANCVSTGEYYLMANFTANTAVGISNVATGVLRKTASREHIYVGSGWSVGLNTTITSSGILTQTSVQNDYEEYTFFGTGVEWRFYQDNSTATATLSIDGVVNLSGYSVVTRMSGTGSYNSTSGLVTLQTGGSSAGGNSIAISGLALGEHTIRILRNSGTGAVISTDSLDIITPIHFPNLKVGSLSMSPGVQIASESAVSGVDLSKAKAWIVFDGSSGNILNSYNISSLLRITTGQYSVYFSKPFKTDRYVAKYGGTSSQMFPSVNGTPSGGDANGMRTSSFTFTTTSTSGTVVNTTLGCLAFFGELEDEE